jgi:integrase
MRSRPRGRRYRNLVRRGETIYFEKVVTGRRFRHSCKTDDWELAAAVRDEWERQTGVGPPLAGAIPSFREFAARYLAEDSGHLAPTTRGDLDSYLREGGPLMGAFADWKLDEITVPRLREWWNREVVQAGRSVRTGRAYLDVLSNILGYAVELELIESSPVPAFRQHVRRRQRTQRGRAQAERNVRPIEEPKEYERLLEATVPEGPEALVYVLLGLDAGLRQGEALGLRWGRVAWGQGEADPFRHLLIDASRSRGGPLGPPKSGRSREVALSRRLHRALSILYRQRWKPGSEKYVLGELDPSNFRAREWRRILKRAGIGERRYKDLRDTFASQLLSAGVQLGYVSAQLGHADVAVTARHYAKWVNREGYREPMRLRSGDVPADFIARMVYESPQSPPSEKAAGDSDSLSPRPLLRKLVELGGIEPPTLRLPGATSIVRRCANRFISAGLAQAKCAYQSTVVQAVDCPLTVQD